MSVEDELYRVAKGKKARLRIPSRIDRSQAPVIVSLGELRNLINCIAYLTNLSRVEAPKDQKILYALAAFEAYGLEDVCKRYGIDLFEALRKEKAVR